MSTKSRIKSKIFDSRAIEAQAQAAIRAKRSEGWTWRQMADVLEVDPTWPIKLEQGKIEHPSIHRIGRVLERLS